MHDGIRLFKILGGFSMSMRIFAVLAALCLSVSAFAAQTPTTNNKNAPPKPEGWILGMDFSALYGEANTYITGGYINDWVIATLGADFESFTHSQNVGAFLGHLGMRGEIVNNLYYTVGAMGQAVVGNTGCGNSLWSAGAFVGLDLHLFPQVFLSAKIYPYAYEHGCLSAYGHNVFADGVLSVFYLF